MLGNDIVDLSVDERKYSNPRFINRILTEIEIQYLARSNNKNVFLWSLWAAKEASYKAFQKTSLHSIFSPKQFELNSDDLAVLLHHDFKQTLEAKLTHQNSDFNLLFSWPKFNAVHCVAFNKDVLLENIQISITNQWDDQIEPSQSSQVRHTAQQLLHHNQMNADIVRPVIKMSGYSKPGPPLLINQTGIQLPQEISLSHDGSWLAVALLINKNIAVKH
jgi:phosphopantetheine--protein transferase-like protein